MLNAAVPCEQRGPVPRSDRTISNPIYMEQSPFYKSCLLNNFTSKTKGFFSATRVYQKIYVPKSTQNATEVSDPPEEDLPT